MTLSFAALSLAACGTVPKDAGYGAVSFDVQSFVGAAPAWPRSAEAQAQTQVEADTILAQELTPDSAVRLALINSPRVRAVMEGLGIARADFLMAARPPNPVLDFVGLGRQQPGPIDLQLSVAIPILDLILLPQRTRAGRAEFELSKANATRAVIDVAVQTRAALTNYIAAREIADFYAQASDIATVGEAAARAIYDAGNSAKVDLDRERLFTAETTAERMQAEAALGPAREKVNATLGLEGARAETWTSAIRLPPPPSEPIDIAGIQTRAVERSLALRDANARLQVVASRRGMINITSVLHDLSVQYQYTRDDDELKRGGGVSLALPIFDLGFDQRLRASSEFRQAYEERRAVEVELRAQVRASAERAESARKLAIYRRQTVFPISNEVFSGVQLNTNAGQVGIFNLLQAKRDNLEAGRQSISALRDYWTAWGELQGLFSINPGAQSCGIAAARSTSAPTPESPTLSRGG